MRRTYRPAGDVTAGVVALTAESAANGPRSPCRARAAQSAFARQSQTGGRPPPCPSNGPRSRMTAAPSPCRRRCSSAATTVRRARWPRFAPAVPPARTAGRGGGRAGRDCPDTVERDHAAEACAAPRGSPRTHLAAAAEHHQMSASAASWARGSSASRAGRRAASCTRGRPPRRAPVASRRARRWPAGLPRRRRGPRSGSMSGDSRAAASQPGSVVTVTPAQVATERSAPARRVVASTACATARDRSRGATESGSPAAASAAAIGFAPARGPRARRRPPAAPRPRPRQLIRQARVGLSASRPHPRAWACSTSPTSVSCWPSRLSRRPAGRGGGALDWRRRREELFANHPSRCWRQPEPPQLLPYEAGAVAADAARARRGRHHRSRHGGEDLGRATRA